MDTGESHHEIALPSSPFESDTPMKASAPRAQTRARRNEIVSLGKWLQHTVGIDRAIVFTVLARIWSSSAGLITVLLIARFLTRAEQGYYYTFSSLVALQIVFELGFSFVILQMASHERVYLTISSNLDISGDPVAHRRLASVFQKSVHWYSCAALLLALFLV